MFAELQADTSPLGIALSRVSTATYQWRKKPRLWSRRRKTRCEMCHPPGAVPGGLGHRYKCPRHARPAKRLRDLIPPIPPRSRMPRCQGHPPGVCCTATVLIGTRLYCETCAEKLLQPSGYVYRPDPSHGVSCTCMECVMKRIAA